MRFREETISPVAVRVLELMGIEDIVQLLAYITITG